MPHLYKRPSRPGYYAKIQVSGRVIRRATGVTNQRAALAIANKWEEELRLEEAGVDTAVDRNLASLLDDFIEYMGSATPKHQNEFRQRIERIVADRGWSTIDDIDEYGTVTAVRGFKQLAGNKEKKVSVSTQNHYWTAIKAFTAWLTDVRKVLMRDPLKGLKKRSSEGDRKRIRRFLLPAEWVYLAQTPNAVLYRTAIETGFRRNELMALEPSMLKEDHIRLPAEFDKRRRVARQYINADLRAQIKLPFEVVGGTRDRLAELLAADLETARKLYLEDCKEREVEPEDEFLMRETPDGILDFHALRHTCGAWLVMNEVNIKIVQKVMRHSTIKLTLDTYGHLMPGAEREAVKALQSVFTS